MAKHSITRRIARLSLQLAGLFTLMSCSAVDFLNFTIPRSGYTLEKNIAYGENPRQKMDIYIPDGVKSPPVIMFFYGGSWKMGSKDDYRFVGEAFASKGYMAVIADYRIYPEVYFPDFVHDGADAFTWVHNHVAEYGGNPDELFLAGHSAGAYIAMMLTVNGGYIKEAGGKPSWVKGMVGIAGPYDFLPFTGDVKTIFSKKTDYDTQPINFVKPHLPPMLLLTGDADKDVLPRNSINLALKLRADHDAVEVKIYPDVAHIGIILSLARGFRGKAPVLSDIDDFIHANSANP